MQCEIVVCIFEIHRHKTNAFHLNVAEYAI